MFPFLIYNIMCIKALGGIFISVCNLCPRGCNIDRKKSLGYCKMPDEILVSKADLHFFEEPCVSGTRGAGTVFFSGCNLSCVYCQNHKISAEGFGKKISVERLREIFLELIDRGAHNIELVTPSHFADKIIPALTPKLPVPVIYNCGGYESVSTLKKLNGLIDVYMPDFKYGLSKAAKKYSGAEDYPEVCIKALEEMYRQVGNVELDQNGLIKKGLIIRHLILPNNPLNTKAVILSLAEFLRNKKALFSLMAQYTPMDSCDFNKFPELKRAITKKEYESALSLVQRFECIEGYFQELSSTGEKFIPEFNLSGV